MHTVPRVACINDLSGFGRCSLTTALPVLSVMGVQACPAPTAVLSKHTGFPGFTFTDLTDGMAAYFESWNDLRFDWIYSGFLGSVDQIELVRRFFRSQKALNPACKILLDPVMGDDGKKYSTYTKELCDAMRQLVAEADVITPNITEACLLTDTAYHGEALHHAEAAALAEQLMLLGCGSVVITGIVQENTIGNLTYYNGKTNFYRVHRTECLFSGTGDLFASVLCGALAGGASLNEAVKKSGQFLSEVTQYTLQENTPAAEGVLFEPLLRKLGDCLYE
ncbi:MAG: pyridoxamine kinase [Oscillospiraceae bacterium]|nr:pyridoxamine kinase [Oscillospiraceae bacterium]